MRAMAIANVDIPPAAGKKAGDTALLVMTSEQPFCGGLTQNVVTAAEARSAEMAKTTRVQLFVAGRRGAAQFASRGIQPQLVVEGATSLEGVDEVVKRLAEPLATLFTAGDLSSVRVIYASYKSLGEQVPTEESILPPDVRQLRGVAVPETGRNYYHYLSHGDLVTGILAEYAFVSLYRIAVEMFVSEQAARLVAMDTATRHAESTLESLRARERQERQKEVTRQVLELVNARLAATR